MKGYIDLIFEYNNKFYIIDYKSNYLGSDLSFYEKDKLKHVMWKSGYYLQYHIYIVALYKYLKNFFKNDFDYETKIGGVYYLFLRGIREKNGDKTGVFFDKPSFKMIKTLSKYLSKEKEI